MEKLPEFTFEIESKKIKYDSVDDAGLKSTFEILEKNLGEVQKINLSGNSYSKEFFDQFSKILEKAAGNIRVANLNDVFVGRKADQIPMALTSITSIFIGQNLQKLDLSNNAVGPNGSLAIAPYLESAKALKVFLISNCGLGIMGITTLSQALIDGAPNLEVLAIARNRAENEGAQALSKALANKKLFRELHIFQNVIREPGMVALVKALRTCPSLELLDVRDNYMKNEAAKELSLLIKESTSIRSLNLSDCNMESEENVHFVEAFENTSTYFEKISYNYNGLSHEHAERLLNALLKTSSKTLKRLDIKGNEFKKKTKILYDQLLEQANLKPILSGYESDSDEEDAIVKEFSELAI